MGILNILKSGEFYKLRKYRIWKGIVHDYINNPLQPFKVFMIHQRGFTVADWEILGLSKDNYFSYLSSKKYNSIHPINGYYSKIIDDKINIKYVLNGTELSDYMPDYYFIIDESGIIRPMMDIDSKNKTSSVNDVIALLKEKKKLALKLITGSIGKGFYKAEYKNDNIYVNDTLMHRNDFAVFIPTLKNYIVSEYLNPHPYIAEFWPNTANTLRFLVGSVNGEWRMLKSFIRFGSSKSGVVENFNAGGVLCYIDDSGHFYGGYVIGKKRKHSYAIKVDYHPDTNKLLDGQIPCWNEIIRCSQGIERLLPQTRYLGFDFVVTDNNNIKLLEINSLTSLDSIQMDKSILKTDNGKWFFSSFFK